MRKKCVQKQCSHVSTIKFSYLVFLCSPYNDDEMTIITKNDCHHHHHHLNDDDDDHVDVII